MSVRRVRMVFEDRNLLSKKQRARGLRCSWVLLVPQLVTVHDLTKHVAAGFGLRVEDPDSLVLSMDEYVLPPFESTCILRDDDVVRVKRKICMSKNVTLPCNEHHIQEPGILEKSTKSCLDEMPGIMGQENIPQGTKMCLLENGTALQDVCAKRKCLVLDNPQPTKRKKLKQSEIGEQITSLSKGKGIMQGFQSCAIIGGSSTSPVRSIPILKDRQKFCGIQKPISTYKKLKRSKGEELDIATENDESKQPQHHLGVQNDGASNQSIHNKTVPSYEEHSASTRIASGAAAVSEEQKLLCIPERHLQIEVDSQVMAGEPHHVGNSEGHVADTVAVLSMHSHSIRVPSRSARRKKAKRKYFQQLKKDLAMDIGDQTLSHELPATEPQKMVSKQGNGVQHSSHCPSYMKTEELKSMQHELGKKLLNGCDYPGLSELSTDQDDTSSNELVPVLVGHGHIRFQTSGSSNFRPNGQDNVGWNGITSKKKGRNWGKEGICDDSYDETCGDDKVTENTDHKEEKTKCDVNFEDLYPLIRHPKQGDLIAYRLVELSPSWCPEVSSFRVGEVLTYDPISKRIILLPVSQYPIHIGSKDEQGDEVSLYKEDGSLEIDYSSLLDIRLMRDADMKYPAIGSILSSGNEAAAKTRSKGTKLSNGTSETERVSNPTENPSGESVRPQEAGWEQFCQNQASAEQQQSNVQENGWAIWTPNKKCTTSTRAWSYRAARGGALGPTVAYLRGKKDTDSSVFADIY